MSESMKDASAIGATHLVEPVEAVRFEQFDHCCRYQGSNDLFGKRVIHRMASVSLLLLPGLQKRYTRVADGALLLCSICHLGRICEMMFPCMPQRTVVDECSLIRHSLLSRQQLSCPA